MQMAAARCQAFRRFRGDVTRVEPIADASLRFELRPELADFETFGYASPEVADVHAKGHRLCSGLPGGWGGGGHEVSRNYRGVAGVAAQTSSNPCVIGKFCNLGIELPKLEPPNRLRKNS